MNTQANKKLHDIILDAAGIVLSIFLIAFPLSILPYTTDIFLLPKQMLLVVAVGILLFLFCAKMIVEKKIVFRHTPLDLSLFVLILLVTCSAFFAVNRSESLMALVPFIFAALFYYIIVNLVRSSSSLLLVVSSIVLGGVFLATYAILSYFKIYVLTFAFAQTPSFSPLGSLVDQAVYLGLILPASGFLALPLFSARSVKKMTQPLLFGIGYLIITTGFALTLYQIFFAQQPLLLLPFATGFQTAFAAISQDSNRIVKGFLLGSGFGTYASDFTRFKLASFNQNDALWTYTFFRSSSFVLELLATTGILGITSFFYLCYSFLKTNKHFSSARKNPFFIVVILSLLTAFLLPFSFTLYTLFFLLLALFAAWHSVVNAHADAKNYYDFELGFILRKNDSFGFKRHIIPLTSQQVEHQSLRSSEHSRLLPIIVTGLIILIVGASGYYIGNYVQADILFQKSLTTAAQNNGVATYQLQKKAIELFPYKDSYHQMVAQTDFALANSLASQNPKGKQIDTKTQQTIYFLIQESIENARMATTLSPQNSKNWQNLSTIYQGLIGFGQNAQEFTIAAMQQAIMLDPTNPQLYVTLGGIYYQLGQWDNAARQFQLAINLKNNFANAYYNLGHTFEQKQDYQNAKTAYLTVKTLVSNNPGSVQVIAGDIDALLKKMDKNSQEPQKQTVVSPEKQTTLGISTSSAALPPQQSLFKIAAPIGTSAAKTK